MQMLNARYQQLPSRSLNRRVHMWTYGWWGDPVVIFPSASGMAHEWQAASAIDTLRPLIEAGRIKLYCPETNCSESWSRRDEDPRVRVARHQAYERFVIDELVPYIRQDCQSPEIRVSAVGCSLGAFYAANMALKHPEIFQWALCLSGRYRTDRFLGGYSDLDVYYNHPVAYVPNMSGEALDRVRRNTSLTLVVGLGPHEGGCVEETLTMASLLAQKHIPHERDVWGHDSAHHWSWWKRQINHHFSRRWA
jgi:esterase/lipase superfamily enzyme